MSKRRANLQQRYFDVEEQEEDLTSDDDEEDDNPYSEENIIEQLNVKI
jgi:hypothetical protein